MRVHLTKPDVERPERLLRGAELKAFEGDKEVMIFDADRPGLVLRLQRRNDGTVKKVFYVRFRIKGLGRQYLKLDTLDLHKARERANEVRDQASQGIHPRIVADEEAAKAKQWLDCPFFKDYANKFVLARADAEGDEAVRAKTMSAITLALKGPCSEPFNDYRLHQISKRMVAKRMKEIAETSVSTAKIWLTYAKQMFECAIVEDAHIDLNPAEGLKAKQPQARDRWLNSEELAAVWNATAGADEFSKIVRLIVLLGGRRRTEVGAMRWSEIKGNVWTLPPERHKTGDSSGELVLPLLPEALKIIHSMPEDGDTVFSDRFNHTDASGWKYDKQKFDKRLPLAKWDLHDLRRTAATLMPKAGISLEDAKRLTNHVGKKGRDTFAIHYDQNPHLEEKTAALCKWANYIHQLAGDNVVPLEKKAA